MNLIACAGCSGMKMTDLLRIIEKMRLINLVILLLFASSYVEAIERDVLAVRREYNDVSAAVDSLVRMMQVADAEVLNKLPEARAERVLPEGMTAVMIFWADDEARVWLNDFPVGETRLTPVEVTVPDLYFQGQNRLRVRCWDTDRVESGFLGGLYLKDRAGRLYPIVVSNGTWETTGGRVTEITYAHPMPDIPGAQPIWGVRMFGFVDMAITFDRGTIERALAKSAPTISMAARQQAMDYHTFAQQLAILQARREKLRADLARQGDLNVPRYNRERARSVSLTLGKAAPLTEEVSAPVAKNVRSWSEKLPAVQQQLIYPDRRALKGEGAATATTGDVVPTASDRGSREQAYRPPEELGGIKSKTKDEGVNAQVQPQGMSRGGAGGHSNQATRLGLLLPTLILGFYVLYVVIRWQSLMGESD